MLSVNSWIIENDGVQSTVVILKIDTDNRDDYDVGNDKTCKHVLAS